MHTAHPPHRLLILTEIGTKLFQTAQGVALSMTNIHHVEEQCDLWVVDDISCEIDDIFKNSNCIKDTTTYEQDLS